MDHSSKIRWVDHVSEAFRRHPLDLSLYRQDSAESEKTPGRHQHVGRTDFTLRGNELLMATMIPKLLAVCCRFARISIMIRFEVFKRYELIEITML